MQPSLHTQRLILRPFHLDDANAVQRLAGDWQIADMTLAIPHPYPDGAAEEWISSRPDAFAEHREFAFAVVLRDTEELVGNVSLLDISVAQARAEVGYWIGVPFWGRGYCSEAVARLLQYAREEWQFTRLVGRCIARNPASARVMIKAGLKPEGHLVKHLIKRGKAEDVLLFGLSLHERGDLEAKELSGA